MSLTKKPALLATDATRRKALSLASRALAVVEQVLRTEQAGEPERRPPAVERGPVRVMRQAS
jgi:hypothetical protein